MTENVGYVTFFWGKMNMTIKRFFPALRNLNLAMWGGLLLCIYSCEEIAPIAVEDGIEEEPCEEEPYPDVSEWDARLLSFQVSEDVEPDTVLITEIQSRLEIARSVDAELERWGPIMHWLPWEILLRVTTEVASKLDTASNRFNNSSLDALLGLYPVKQMKPSPYTPERILLRFCTDYNIPILCNVFRVQECVVSASPNHLLYLESLTDLHLAIEGDIYKFMFMVSCVGAVIWEIHVTNDEAIVIKRPDSG